MVENWESKPMKFPERLVIVIHPGGSDNWECNICKLEVSTHVALVKHLPELHQTRIREYRCTYGFSSTTVLRVGTHKRCCQGFASKEKTHKCQ